MEMERVNLRGPEMIQRLQAEAASGKYVGNLVTHGQTTMSTVDAAGGLTDWDGPPTAPLIPVSALTEGRTRWAGRLSLYSSIVNTDLVPKDKIPTSRQMFLDPFFKGKGKILIEDPRAGGPGLDVFTLNYVQLGQQFLDAIKAQDATFVRDRDNAPSQVARGEYAIFYPVLISSDLFELEKAAPVKVNILTDGGTSLQESTIGVVKDAPGQDAAKLFVSWLLSEEGQKMVVSDLQNYSPLPGLGAPAGYPKLEDVHPSTRTSDQIKRNNEYIEIFDKTFFQ
jgi:iron(III) transport system substrate-binding protein